MALKWLSLKSTNRELNFEVVFVFEEWIARHFHTILQNNRETILIYALTRKIVFHLGALLPYLFHWELESQFNEFPLLTLKIHSQSSFAYLSYFKWSIIFS